MAEDQDGTGVPREDTERLMALWGTAVETTRVQETTPDRALVWRINFRVKFPEAFLAAYHTFEAGTAVGSAVAVQATWPIAVLKCYQAAMSLFSTLVETMQPLSYVTAVILATHKEGVEGPALQEAVNAFLDNPNTRAFPWYLGMDSTVVEEASGDRDGDWFGEAIRDLETNGFLKKKGDLLLPKGKHYEWKI